MRAVVIALGKVGLPLAAKLTLAGHEVVGCDIDDGVVASVNAGRAPFPNEQGLEAALASAAESGLLRASVDTAAAITEHRPELIVAVPPLYVDDAARPDWTVLDSVVSDIAAGLRAGQCEQPPVVAIETTMPVGSTRDRISKALETQSGGVEGVSFHTVFSPERVFSGRALADLDAYPKLVGGVTSTGESRACACYAAFLAAEIRAMGSAEAAELAKLAETTYRDINIAFANELARYSDVLGIDVLPVIDAANSQPYSHIHRPGIAVGGHCIPVYPRFLMQGNEHTTVAAAARAVNDAMPAYAASLLGDDVAGRRVLILGVAYRGGVRETAFSGAFGLRDALEAAGASVLAADPLYASDDLEELGFSPWDGEPVDAAIVHADHPEYRTLSDRDLPGVRQIVDGRGILNPAFFPDLAVRRIGRPDGSAADTGSLLAPAVDQLGQRPS
jgi:UDP-N-acetyl-D-mannosaminuronic acid dehydrogenase